MPNNTEIDSEWEVIQCDMVVEYEPIIINEALKKKVWMKAMKEELEAAERNKIWELTILHKNKKSISVRWVFKIKLKPNGSVAKRKARLIAR